MPKLARLMSPASEYPRVKFIQLDSHVVFQTNSGAMKDLQGPVGGGWCPVILMFNFHIYNAVNTTDNYVLYVAYR